MSRLFSAAVPAVGAEEVVSLNLIDRCFECGQPLPQKPTHVYAVKVRLNSGAEKWLYSDPLTQKEAERNAVELRATGYNARAMTTYDAENERQTRAAKAGKKRRRK